MTDGAVILPVMSAVSVTETDFSARTSPSIVPSMTTRVASTLALTLPSRPIVSFWVRVIEPSILPLMTKSSSEDSSPLNLIVGPRIEVRSFKVLYGLLIDRLPGAGASMRFDRRERMLRAPCRAPHQPRHKTSCAELGKAPSLCSAARGPRRFHRLVINLQQACRNADTEKRLPRPDTH